jgi:hypothetical protein
MAHEPDTDDESERQYFPAGQGKHSKAPLAPVNE